jgi:diadenosine tetraphosphatase ApaH/serine/threonine PP2A family protein phosphatase
MLVQPFDLGRGSHVPAHLHRPVLDALRDAWVQARHQAGTFLKPPVIAKLRQAYEDQASQFVLGSFSLDLLREKLSYVIKASQPMPPAISSTAPVGTPPPSSGFATMYLQAFQSQQAANMGSNSRQWSYRTSSLTAGNIAAQVDPPFLSAVLKDMKDRRLPSTDDVQKIVSEAHRILGEQETLVELDVPANATLHVVGDLHGQFWDLCKILDVFGLPSKENWYVFNGDFVDRGQFSVEVVIALFTMKIASPRWVHLNRGNHESIRMNILYGFMNEAKTKYSPSVFNLIIGAFKNLPLATLVNKSVFVVHGGLPRQDGVRLRQIATLDRTRDPDETAPDLMIDLLWSDPMDGVGRDRSPRGAGTLFGSDVSERFCKENGLTCVIRSHEMKFEGYEWHHNDMCLTIFSAANYCDMCGNYGAVCSMRPRADQQRLLPSDFQIERFESAPHPSERIGGFSFGSP